VSDYWQGVVSRLSVPGLVLLGIGVAVGYGAPKIAAWLWKGKGERAVLFVRVTGLALAILGTLMLVDIIPI
jgi:hypothetical protein